MTVVALAGHVDHGKTALVRSLTGIETDRLREEKERGMTTDLGFASLVVDSPDGKGTAELGIIDVPGHERYIRNMAGGAWGADLVLLVVAADDGWMAQTETHARVLAALGSPRVIVVLTKTDNCEGTQVELNGEDAHARASLIFGATAVADRWYPVSNRSGEGMPALLEGLALEAIALEATRHGATKPAVKPDAPSPAATPDAGGQETPLLFIDRVFSKSGAGLVVCGTLRGAPIRIGDELDLYPAMEHIRVRGLEALGEKSDTARPHERVALNISRPSVLPRRGDLLTLPGNGGRNILSGTEFLVRFEPVPTSLAPKKEDARDLSRVLAGGGEAELSLGSAYRIVRIQPLGKGCYYRILCDESLPVPRQLPAVLLRHGGAEVLGRLRFLRSGRTDKKNRHTLLAALAGLENLSLDPPLAPLSLILETRLAGFLELSAADEAALAGNPRLAGTPGLPLQPDVAGLLAEKGIQRRGTWLLDSAFLTRVLARAREAAVNLPGKSDLVSAALVSAFTLPKALAEILTREGLGPEAPSMAAPGVQVAAGSGPVLDPATKAAEKSLRLAGSAGFEGSSKEVDRLCALRLAIPLDRTLFIHVEVYQALVAKALAGKKSGDRIDIAEAKTRTGYSRKYILPFLNRLERDLWVKRDGDARVVLRTPEDSDRSNLSQSAD